MGPKCATPGRDAAHDQLAISRDHGGKALGRRFAQGSAMVTHSAWLAGLRGRLVALLGVLPAAAGCHSYVFEPCESDEPDETGLAVCEAGYLHRASAVTCETMGPATTADACQSDEHCTDLGFTAYCYCGSEGGFCTFSECLSDADCEAPYACASVDGSPYLACQTAEDECMVSADCGSDSYCTYDGTRRVCYEPEDCGDDCVMEGRPFLVDDECRTAPVIDSAEWCIELDAPPSVTELAPQLADHWSRVGRMEHASIAAFARLSLQLISLGAPPSLIDRATKAMADESRHAKIAFSLASHYASQDVGPGPLPVDGALAELDLTSLVRLSIREGCVGETAAALVVRDGALSCEDPTLKAQLLGIADDELEHAELAWATIAWAVAKDPGQRATIRDELARLDLRDHPAAQDEPLARHGVVSEQRFRNLRTRALRELVAPLLVELAREPDAPQNSRRQSDLRA